MEAECPPILGVHVALLSFLLFTFYGIFQLPGPFRNG